MQRVSIITLGCKVNQYESESIAKVLADNGFIVEFGLTEADIYVLNTCAVTNEAERKSRGLIAKVLKLNPNAKIYVCGCSAQNNPTSFARFKQVLAVYGTGRKMDIANLILEDFNGKQLICNTITSEYEERYCPKLSHTRAYIKVQDGCNNFCSYCIIPYLRGRSRSRELDKIKEEIDFLSAFTKEIIITGINLSAYGEDLEPKKSLIDIAKLFNEKSVRFRYSSLEVNVINEDFLRTLKDMPNFCDHFHLSMQSGCDKTLKDMNRHYTVASFLNKVALIRKYFPNSAITTDVIVGFPTETDEDFNETYKTCKKAKFADMHIFPYSPRRSTVALQFKNIATHVNERIKVLTELKISMKENFIFGCLGSNYEVLIEGKQTDNNYYEGHTKNYIKCYIKAENNIKPNSIIMVKLTELFKDGALAEPLTNSD